MNNTIEQEQVAKLRWQCRRGMLELDVLLNDFLSTIYPSLPVAEQTQFQALLACNDQELYGWLMGFERPIPAKWMKLIRQIRYKQI